MREMKAAQGGQSMRAAWERSKHAAHKGGTRVKSKAVHGRISELSSGMTQTPERQRN